LRKLLRNFLLVSLLQFSACEMAFAQDTRSSPEIEQMFAQVKDYEKRLDFADAIVVLNQALAIEPGNLKIRRELASCLLQTGNYPEILNKFAGDERDAKMDSIIFFCLTTANARTGNIREANRLFKKCLAVYPHYGELYHELGLLLEQNNPDKAVETWRSGVVHAPRCAANYFELCRAYYKSGMYTDCIFCGEIFVNLENKQNTEIRDAKTMLFESYKALFRTSDSHGKKKKDHDAISASNILFAQQNIDSILFSLTPVVSDGVTADNLAMLRTRMLIVWYSSERKQTPGLIAYQDHLLRNGWFDIYNEWLFGEANDTLQYKSWNSFHIHAIDSFLNWKNEHISEFLLTN